MAVKKIEEYTTDELKKFYRSFKTILIIEATLAGILLLFILFSSFTGKFTLNIGIYIMPIVFIGVMVGPIASMNRFKKELQNRGETI